MKFFKLLSSFIIISAFKWCTNAFVEGYNWDGKNWNIELTSTNKDHYAIVNNNKKLTVKSVDAGFFYKDINEELFNCNYVYSGFETKEHFLSCVVEIKNYSRRNSKRVFYIVANFGKNQGPNDECSFNKNTKLEINLYDVIDGKKKMTNSIGKKRYNQFKTSKSLDFPSNIKKKVIEIKDKNNSKCDYELEFDQVNIFPTENGTPGNSYYIATGRKYKVSLKNNY